MDVINFKFKILVLGAVGVGRTAFEVYVRSLNPHNSDQLDNARSKSMRFTTGASLSGLNMDIGAYKVSLLFWVISENEINRFLVPSFIKSAKGAILLYDITDASSIMRLPYWRHMIADYCGDIPIVLAGNKLDLGENRVISKKEGLDFQREHQLTSFREISMKTGEGVYEMFEYLRDLLLQTYKYLVE